MVRAVKDRRCLKKPKRQSLDCWPTQIVKPRASFFDLLEVFFRSDACAKERY